MPANGRGQAWERVGYGKCHRKYTAGYAGVAHLACSKVFRIPSRHRKIRTATPGMI